MVALLLLCSFLWDQIHCTTVVRKRHHSSSVQVARVSVLLLLFEAPLCMLSTLQISEMLFILCFSETVRHCHLDGRHDVLHLLTSKFGKMSSCIVSAGEQSSSVRYHVLQEPQPAIPLPCGPHVTHDDQVYDLHAAHVTSGITHTEQVSLTACCCKHCKQRHIPAQAPYTHKHHKTNNAMFMTSQFAANLAHCVSSGHHLASQRWQQPVQPPILCNPQPCATPGPVQPPTLDKFFHYC